MDFREFLKNNIVCLDGAMGTMLQANGLAAGQLPERWNISHPDVVTAIHKSYYDAGSNVVSTNTFGANSLKFDDEELEEIIKSALENAKSAREQSVSDKEKFVALDIGPTGKLLKPLGELDFEDAVAVFAKTVKLGVKYGADLIVIETMNDSYETKAALLAAKENSTLPVIVTNVYGKTGRLMTGATTASMVAMLEGMGADAIGANCSLGPKQLAGVAKELLENASVPVVIKPNAGLPEMVDGKTVYNVSAEEFATEVANLVKEGVRLVGGCCGTTPEYIKCVCDKIKDLAPKPVRRKGFTVISSRDRVIKWGEEGVGTNVLPLDDDIDTMIEETIDLVEKFPGVLLIWGIDDAKRMETVITELQAVCTEPFMIQTDDVQVLESALRRYNGKALVSTSLKEAKGLVKKYGGVIDK